MKKHIPSFLAGALSAVLALALCGTALAAAGKISYNTVNIALNGERRVAAGTDAAAPNGRQVPASILYTDEAGGKTNYLPIRTIGELLGVEVGYDAASGTVLLDRRESPQAREGWKWQRELDGGHVTYMGPEGAAAPEGDAPLWRPARMPEGWGLDGVSAAAGCTWTYHKGEERLELTCRRLGAAHIGAALKTKDAASVWQAARVAGRPADLYRDEDSSLLAWESADGTLFLLSAVMEPAALEQIAAGVAETRAQPLPDYRLGWLPDGSGAPYARSVLREAVQEQFLIADGAICGWMYAAESAGPLAEPEGTPETVAVNGRPAHYWPGDPAAGGGVTVTTGSTGEVKTLPGRGEEGVLLWTDPDTAVTFRIRGALDRDALIRMAESVTLQTA